jgi:hypothetical protein
MKTIAEQYHRSRREYATAQTKVRQREILTRMKALLTKQIRKEVRAERRKSH